MSNRRIQLTLFVSENESGIIERLREEFNPEQYALIKSHVTLCREDELETIEKITQQLTVLNHGLITIDFRKATRFSEGKGVLLPSRGDNKSFQELRATILAGLTGKRRMHEPHITLMHPRNSTCTDEIFEQIEKFILPGRLTFRKISLIEQADGNKWEVLREF
jgi:2'-5' RNA ligase